MSYGEPHTPRPLRSAFLPFLLLGIGLLMILIWQVVVISKQGRDMSQAREQLAEGINQRNALVEQSTELKKKLEAVVLDLLALAKTNERAQAIVQKYNIQQTVPAGGTPAAEPTP